MTLKVKSLEMANAPEVVKAPGMVPDELKQEPRSKGITFARKKKPTDGKSFQKNGVAPVYSYGCAP